MKATNCLLIDPLLAELAARPQGFRLSEICALLPSVKRQAISTRLSILGRRGDYATRYVGERESHGDVLAYFATEALADASAAQSVRLGSTPRPLAARGAQIPRDEMDWIYNMMSGMHITHHRWHRRGYGIPASHNYSNSVGSQLTHAQAKQHTHSHTSDSIRES